jgi:hypothetical protein
MFRPFFQIVDRPGVPVTLSDLRTSHAHPTTTASMQQQQQNRNQLRQQAIYP